MFNGRTVLVRCFINAVAFGLVLLIIPGVQISITLSAFLKTLLVFILINEILRPVRAFLTFALVLILVLPLQTALNMMILAITKFISGWFGVSLGFDDLLTLFCSATAIALGRFMLSESVRLYEIRRKIRRQCEWMEELTQAKDWLTEQVCNWQKMVEERQRVIHEQQAWIEELERAKAWLSAHVNRESTPQSK